MDVRVQLIDWVRDGGKVDERVAAFESFKEGVVVVSYVGDSDLTVGCIVLSRLDKIDLRSGWSAYVSQHNICQYC